LSPRQLAVCWLLIVGAYFASRLYALTLLPIFIDETDHLRRALWIVEGEKLFRAWNRGKGLGVWITAAALPWSSDPLWAGRAAMVALGAVSLWACYRIAAVCFGERAGLAAAAFYIVCPFTLMYDRLALSDSFAATFAALALLASLSLARSPGWRPAVAAGVALALAVLSKVNALLALAAPAAALGLLRPLRPGGFRALAIAYAAAVAIVGYPLWVFFATPHVVEVGMGGTGEQGALAGAGAKVAQNVALAGEWLAIYWTLPLVGLAVLGPWLVGRERRREAVLLAFLALWPVAAYLPFARIWFPRYLVMACVPFLALAAAGLVSGAERIRQAWPRLGPTPALLGFALAAIPALRLDVALWSDPSRAALPRLERYQYQHGWPSGYGVRETVDYFRRELAENPEGFTIVAHGPSRRTTLQALGLYFALEPRVELRDLDLADASVGPALREEARVKRVYLLVSPLYRTRGRPRPETWDGAARKVLSTRKPDGSLCDEVYELGLGVSDRLPSPLGAEVSPAPRLAASGLIRS
jgi:hypothetical protein